MNEERILNLLAQLEEAVSSGDLGRSALLISEIRSELAAYVGFGAREIEESLARLSASIPDAEVSSITYKDQLGSEAASIPKDFPYGGPRSARDPGDEAVVIPVWFGTNRMPLTTESGTDGFNSKRSATVNYGRVEVVVPKGHIFGKTGENWLRKFLRMRRLPEALFIHRVVGHGEDEFWSDIHGHIDGTTRRDGLVFIHGFNVSFESAAIRAAQMAFDLKVDGGTAFFSWPSRGHLAGYVPDSAAIEASENEIAKFLEDFACRSGANQVHVVAHSMGNRGLLRALQRIAADAERRTKVKFSQIFLAAPDVDRDLFIGLSTLFPQFGERTTLYASRADLAVYTSKWIHGSPRAGYFDPYTVVDRIDTIEVPDFDLDLIGHGYFAEAKALLYDMYGLIRTNAPPDQRPNLTPVSSLDGNFWRFGL